MAEFTQPKPATGRSEIPARQRLLLLPEVFRGAEATVIFGWKSAICSTYLANWRKLGLIKSLGTRSDVHMNLVRSPQANLQAALRRAYPNGILVGVDVLREAGWTTQIPSRPEVVVPLASTIYDIEAYEITTRTDKWFDRVRPGIEVVDSQDGVDRLRPAWALADMLARAQDRRVHTSWLLDPEDIELEEARADKHAGKALAAFGLEADACSDESYEQVYEAWRVVRDAGIGAK